jgi:hypothetical protein
MSGLAQLVPYFECQYPQVLPMTGEQASAVINSSGAANSGVGDYVNPFPWPIPQYLTPGNMKGLGCGGGCGCSDCEHGLGQGSVSILGTTIQLTAPGGYFSTTDFTQWGLEEWGTVAGAAYFLFSLIGDTKKHVRKARRAAKAYQSTS